MGVPLSGPINVTVNCCELDNGSPVGGVRPYVVSLNALQGILTIAADGGVSVRSEGGTIYIGADGTAGLGTVTSVNATSSNNNLTVSGGPVTTTGTFEFDFDGNIGSISGLVAGADQMLYSTAVDSWSLTSLTAFARTLLDDANAAAVRTTLGLVIGTNVQAWSADLDSLVTNTSWSGANVTFAGSVTASTFLGGIETGGADADLGGGDLTNAGVGSFAGAVTALSFTGIGTALTALNGSEITSGTVAGARGGTGHAGGYTIGDILYASASGTLSKLADVAAGAFLRSGGVATAPAWSSITLPNSLAVGDILYASTTSAVSRLADVATGNALISGGVSTAPSWGKITTSHTTGIAASGANADITSFSLEVTFSDTIVANDVSIAGFLADSDSSVGTSGQVLTSTGSAILWSNQITLDTLRIDTSLSTEGTITGAGTTGAQTINKLSGTVRFAAAATSLVVTNSLCTTSSRIMAMCSTNDATAYVKNVVPATGAFTITLGAAATSETEVSWLLFNIT